MTVKPPDTPGAPKRVGIWIRVSTKDQARGESPEHHERRARTDADSHGWAVAEVYHLEAVSGESVRAHAFRKSHFRYLCEESESFTRRLVERALTDARSRVPSPGLLVL